MMKDTKGKQMKTTRKSLSKFIMFELLGEKESMKENQSQLLCVLANECQS